MSRQANRTLFIRFVTAPLRRRVLFLLAALTLVSASLSAGPSMLILTGAAMSAADCASRADDTPAVHALFDLSSATESVPRGPLHGGRSRSDHRSAGACRCRPTASRTRRTARTSR